MPKPVLLTVDDDPEVLRAVERDLRKRYADRYRVVRADSGITALQSVQTLKRRNEAVALLLADQRMPEMSGVEFLNKALKVYPEARRVLLTAYADTDAAIQAINEARIHHYLLKPWDPPEEHLYPVLDDLLEDWHAGYRPVFEGVRVLGHRWSPRSYALRDFLGRNQVPYRWLDAETADRDKEVHEALEVAERDSLKLPAAIFLDNTGLSDPSTAELAAKLGLRTSATTSFYDLLIVGGGPAGLAAGVYGASEGLTTVMIEREAPGGQAGMSSRIENYLGFPSGLSGSELTRRAVTQARRFGVEILAPQEAVGLRVDAGSKFVRLADGVEIGAKSLLIATGVAYRKLDVPGLERLQGAGVYYGAAMTEAASCKDEDVFIVGGANSAGQAAMYFANYARRVVMLVRGSSLAEYSRRAKQPGDGSIWNGTVGSHFYLLLDQRGNAESRSSFSFHFYWGGSADGMAARRSRTRREGIHSNGCRLDSSRQTAKDVVHRTRAVVAGGERARNFCCRRCKVPLHQARGVGRGRRRERGAIRAPVPGFSVK